MDQDNCNFIKKETLAQVFSCEFCEIFKNTFPSRTPPVAASVLVPILKPLATNDFTVKDSFAEEIVNQQPVFLGIVWM